MQKGSNGKLSQVLQAINIIPLLLFGIITLVICNKWFTVTMYNEVEQELMYVAHNVNTLMDVAYPGDYIQISENPYILHKGDHDISRSFELIDQVKSDTGLEITVFHQDMRVLTTIKDANGNRYRGTRAPDVVITDVLEGGEAKFYTNTLINGSQYFSYYMPVYNSDGTLVGMIFVGKPSMEVNAAVQKSLYPLMITTVATMVIISVALFLYTRTLVRTLQHIRSFLAEVATGNLTAEMNAAVSGRSDEFGDISRSAMAMQRSLRIMIEQDALTELFNRRSADRKLKQVIQKHQTYHTPFCVAIGDIDFFKKVNDTYGHECGDIVLKKVSDRMREHMRSNGFAARWGGEEFLLVFDHSDILAAHKTLEALLNDIRATACTYENNTIRVTMTFGLEAGNTTNIAMLLHNADEKLYIGKTSGRNRIIWEEPVIPIQQDTEKEEDDPSANVT